ncbi:MAG: hypothetical protein JXQ29_12735 [Planctomycetes bacterium]|nr:hypothetical protein [Planctomycetota bacterium]
MLFTRGLLVGMALSAVTATAAGQGGAREPHIGYLYPAGAARGTVVHVTAGGQFLRGARGVLVSGEGVSATVVRYYRPIFNLDAEERELLRQRLRGAFEKRLAELPAERRAPAADPRRGPRRAERPDRPRDGRKRGAQQGAEGKKKAEAKPGADAKPKGEAKPGEAQGGEPKPEAKPGADAKEKAPAKVAAQEDAGAKKKAETGPRVAKLPEFPLLHDLDSKCLRELVHIVTCLQFDRAKRQMNRQLAESVLIEITVAPDAPPGPRELRIVTGGGLTNPMIFEVGLVPEVCELEPNDREAHAPLPPRLAGMPDLRRLEPAAPLALPVVLNGQIYPGDVDRFRFRARKGQELLIAAQARSLIPYLADAVPGWFQATLALYDAAGREVAFVDDYRFDPDPVLHYRIAEDGEYELEIRDAIYRGREDFVYRIAVGESPFVTEVFPLGGRAGTKTVAAVKGWNLRDSRLPLATEAGGPDVRRTWLQGKNGLSNAVVYAVDTLPECEEKELNDAPKSAQSLVLPVIVNGRIGKPGEVDVFCFEGQAGDTLVAEVVARRLQSPLDSLVRVTDAAGNVLAWNDDHMVKDGDLHRDPAGWITHHADSYLMVPLPGSGAYYVQVADAQHQGGDAYAYRLRLSPPRPDFALRVTPSSLGLVGGSAAPIHVHALRKDGFAGAIDVVLKEAGGFRLEGGRIPAGRDRVRMTLRAPARMPRPTVALELEGRAEIDGETVCRRAVPAEDMMQAFLYRHLVPSEELRVAVAPLRGGAPAIEIVNPLPVAVPAGGTAWVRVKAWRGNPSGEVKVALREPPAGMTVEEVSVVPGGFAFRLKADRAALPVGFADNLLAEASREVERVDRDGKPTGKRLRTSIGLLPAIPFTIVERRVL